MAPVIPMSLFGGRSKIKPSKTVIRTENIAVPAKPGPRPSAIRQKSQQQVVQAESIRRRTTESPAARSSPESHLQVPGSKNKRREKQSRQRSPRQVAKIEWGSDGDDDNEDEGSATDLDRRPRKRQRANSERPVDLKRKLRRAEAFSSEDGTPLGMIHAADVSSAAKKKSARAAGGAMADDFMVRLRYPSAFNLERFFVVFERDQIESAHEILEIAKIVTKNYLTEEQAAEFTEPNNGYIRRIEKAKNLLSRDTKSDDLLNDFKIAVKAYNKALKELVVNGTIATNLDHKHQLSPEIIKCVLRQVYDRAVSPSVDLLKQYENGTDNVYGELLPNFISKALTKTGLKSDHVFIDFGSGVGNVVLQAALEFGCESWGCEMMDNATILAAAQAKEFDSRCKLWGILAGDVHLERGDFLENQNILKAMKKADVILVNNQAFTPELNQKLVQLFLDLKDGCKIVSLKSFVPDGHKISHRSLGNPVNHLTVEKGEYYSKSVSWTDREGTYFIATKDESVLQDWIKANPE